MISIDSSAMINKDKAIMTRHESKHGDKGRKGSAQTARKKKWIKALEERMKKAGL